MKTTPTRSPNDANLHRLMQLTDSCRIFGVLACLLLIASCVSQSKYTALEQSHRKTQQIIDRQNEELTILHQSLENSQREYRDLQNRHNDLIQVNRRLFDGIKALNVQLEKKESVIDIQQKVIRLLDDTRSTIQSSLDEQIAAVESTPPQSADADLVKFILVDKLLFESGRAVITTDGRRVLQPIVAALESSREDQIIVAGHTDSVRPGPTIRDKYPTNWELSVARASAVAKFLLQHGRIDPRRMVVCGYGAHRPVASNDNEAGRQRNRRIEIFLAPAEYLSPPGASSP